MQKNNKIIGALIKEYREANQMTQRELAEKCGYERKTIFFIEHGRSVNSDIVYALCEIFDCTPNELFGFKI